MLTRIICQKVGRMRFGVLFDDKGTTKTLLQLIPEKNRSQGKPPARRADMRFNLGPDGTIFVMNKMDGVIRVLEP